MKNPENTDNTDNTQTHWGNTSFGAYAGMALFILAACLGIGGCSYFGEGGGIRIKLSEPQKELPVTHDNSHT